MAEPASTSVKQYLDSLPDDRRKAIAAVRKVIRTHLEAAFTHAGKELNAGKSCVRFKTADDLPLDAIGRRIGCCTPEQFIAIYETSRPRRSR